MLDLSKASQSVELEPEYRDHNAFEIKGRWYRAKRMLFGVGIGQKVLYLVLKRILQNRAIAYRDDLFIPSREEVAGVLQDLQRNGFRVKEYSKCDFDELTNPRTGTNSIVGSWGKVKLALVYIHGSQGVFRERHLHELVYRHYDCMNRDMDS